MDLTATTGWLTETVQIQNWLLYSFILIFIILLAIITWWCTFENYQSKGHVPMLFQTLREDRFIEPQKLKRFKELMNRKMKVGPALAASEQAELQQLAFEMQRYTEYMTENNMDGYVTDTSMNDITEIAAAQKSVSGGNEQFTDDQLKMSMHGISNL